MTDGFEVAYSTDDTKIGERAVCVLHSSHWLALKKTYSPCPSPVGVVSLPVMFLGITLAIRSRVPRN